MAVYSSWCSAGALWATILFASCTSSPRPVTATQIAEWRAAKVPSHMAVKTTLKLRDGGKTVAAPSVIQKPGHAAHMELVREFIYPNQFSLPVAKAGARQVTPTTPTGFTMRSVGVVINISAKMEGALVVLTGDIAETAFEGFTHAAGEVVARPIVVSKADPTVLSPNEVKLPMFREVNTPIFVIALPGKTYSMQVAGVRGPVWLDVTCELVPEGKR